MEDKDRILAIMKNKEMLAKDFCEATGIKPASLSHILGDKTKPSLSVLKSIVQTFPELNPLWVLLGEGEMFLDSSSDSNLGVDGQKQGQGDILGAEVSKGLPVEDGTDVDGSKSKFQQGEFAFEFPNQTVSNPSVSRSQSLRTSEPPIPPVQEVVKIIEKKPRKIVEIRVFFDDGTYETFS